MYPLGHIGAALIVSAPAVYVLHPRTATGFTVFTLLSALLPDLDKSLPYVIHHGLTHTVFFGVVVGVVGGGLAAGTVAALRRWTDAEFAYRFSPERLFVYVGLGLLLGVVSHVIADMLMTFPGTQPVSPFWPVSSWKFRVVEFLNLGGAIQNSLLITVGLLVHALAAWHSASETARPVTA